MIAEKPRGEPRGIYAAIAELVPSFYDRDWRDIPERRLQRLRRTLAGAVPAYSARAALIAFASSSRLTVP